MNQIVEIDLLKFSEKIKKEFPDLKVTIDDGAPSFRVIVAGSRTFSDYELLCQTLDALLKEKRKTHSISIVSGKAQGADTLGERYAKEHGYNVIEYFANWKLGKAAGPIRNEQMAQNADALVAFWDGTSRGTKHMIDLAGKYGLKIRVKKFENK